MDLKQVMAGTAQTQTEQNLINPSKLGTGQLPSGFYKSIFLDIFSVLGAALFSGAYYWYLTRGLSIWVLLVALMFFAVLSAIQIFLARNNLRRFFVIILESIALVSFFWADDPRILVITGLVMLGTLSWGYFSGHARLKNSIEIPFFTATSSVLSKFTTGALLFMILIYVPQINGNALVVSQKNFSTFFDWTAGTINGFYPELQLTGSFGGFAQSFSKMELQNNPNFQDLSASQQDAAVTQASNQFVAGFSPNASTSIATSTPTSDAFYNVINGLLSGWQSQYSGWFDVGWVTVLFFALRTLGILFVWVGQFMSLVVYEILLASGFMKVAEETHTKEIITF
jgi:hypothetical protein